MKKRKYITRRSFLSSITSAATGIMIVRAGKSKIANVFTNNLDTGGSDLIPAEFSEFENPINFSTGNIIFSIYPSNGSFQIKDIRTNTLWHSNPFRSIFGEIILRNGNKTMPVILSKCTIEQHSDLINAIFHPVAEKPASALKIIIKQGETPESLSLSYEADTDLQLDSVRLLDNALWTTDIEKGYAIIPAREGILIPSDSGLTFSQSFDTYAYEGCHMAMIGIVKNGATVLITWNDPNTSVEIKSYLDVPGKVNARQLLSASVTLSKTCRSFQIQFCGKGDYNTIGQAYRDNQQSQKWRVSWSEKFGQHSGDSKLIGACNVKLWETLSRTMDETSSVELSKSVNWTFAEAAQVAEHIKNDLEIDKCLFILGGWIHRGYDNQHPDILPPAPECGGATELTACARRVMDLGYLFCLHDNYQDIYHDSPSWNEDYIMKKQDGSLAVGGRWSGGTAYLICSRKAVELAGRPQNLPAVKELTGANAYLTDTTFAAGLYECFDHNHPLTRSDDILWKQKLSDYAREIFGVYGSEDGREWALPHGDFFEGLSGVSGQGFHDTELQKKLGASVIPLFEIVNRDGIAIYGKYDYKWEEAAEYVLQHIIFGRTLNYHNIPSHLYWKERTADSSGEKIVLVDKALFLRGDNGWTEGLHPTDRFIKNSHEVLGPLNTITFQMPMTKHRFVSDDKKVQQSVFGTGEKAVFSTVNMGNSVHRCRTNYTKEIVSLPHFGFLVESPDFVAFHAMNWNGVKYDSPPFFTMQSLDEKPLSRSDRIRVYHGFGDNRIKIRKSIRKVQREDELNTNKGTLEN